MNGPRLTEERLRNYLDSNQVMRERMCLALMPLLGSFSREHPRRPKGGPDGGRDIEALWENSVVVWGAVGFKNGGGSDDAARREIAEKFRDDLDRAAEEDPSLAAFVFFTNVDLTPSGLDDLKAYANAKNIRFVDVFDMERLRHALDSAEGLITRLQYLEIPMSITEQAALVAKYGTQLQSAVTARFDRVERTLAQMERFLDFQKPLLRLDTYIELTRPETSATIGDEAVRLTITGLHDISKVSSCLYVSHISHSDSAKALVTLSFFWNEDKPSKILRLGQSIGPSRNVMAAYGEVSLTSGGGRVSIADLTVLRLEAYCTSGLREKIKQVSVDANGYEIFCCLVQSEGGPSASLQWPEGLSYDAATRNWVSLCDPQSRNFLFNPPRPSGRFLPLRWIGQ